MTSAVDGKLEAREPDLGAGPPPLVICVVEPGLNILGLTHPKLSLPFLPAEVGRARGRRVCGGCAGRLWARERYAMSALRCFITPKAKLKIKQKTMRHH